MNQNWQQIVDRLRDLNGERKVFGEGSVVSIDLAKAVAEVLPFGSPVPVDVQLRSGQQSKGFALVPMVGSRVVFGWLSDSQGFLLQAEELSDVLIDGAVKLNGGGNGGMIKVSALVEAINRLEQRMLTHQHMVASPGAPTAPDPATNAPFPLTTAAQLTNSNVMH